MSELVWILRTLAGGVPGSESSRSVRRRRGIGACAIGVMEDGVALGVVR
jgi:hypothetical protein